VTFVETLLVPLGNPITAVVGGSLGGHMALRLAASQKDWVKNVIAWSPACVMDHDFSLLGVSMPQSLLADHVSASRATEAESDRSRADFFSAVWDQATFSPPTLGQAVAAAAALISAGVITGVTIPIVGAGLSVAIAAAIMGLPQVPAQPLMWYRDDWPTGAPAVQLAPWGPAVSVGPAKATYIQEARRDRREIYNAISRRWHWRICGEMIRFKFDALVQKINKPLLLMVGESDNFPLVHFFDNVKRFAGSVTGVGECITVQDTGHSIHNERPYFLALELLAFAPRP
jgi:pimeloyl-ACP methyl ester carboxylesterase